MGVNGITPFLKRFFPEVLQPIPGRFKALKGKRIVLDGTLITQRFHYGQDPHPSKHVLGWYRLAKELHDAGVSAICLFDGKERSEAKSGEVQRRQKARALVHTRGAIEKGRFQRLRGLKDALGEMEKMSEEGKRGVAEAFVGSEVGEEKGEGAKKRDEQISPEHPKQVLQSLYLNYCANQSRLATLEDKDKGEEEEKVPEHVSTKAQHELSVQENAIWRDISLVFSNMAHSTSPSTPSPTPLTPTPTPTLSSIKSHLSSIQSKSHIMSSSFDRRTHSPRDSTYAESKALLRAAGIPCVDAPATVEAEALGAAVVLGGWADYVGSEDTDILIYEAPMLKNITSRSDSLILVDGSHVRRSLGLTRAAYVDFALLLGTDFTTRIRGVGPMKALGVVRRWGRVEGVFGVRSGEGVTEQGVEGVNGEERCVEAVERGEVGMETKALEVDISEPIENNETIAVNQGEIAKEHKIASIPLPLSMDKDKYLAQVEVARLIFGRLPVVPSEMVGLMRDVGDGGGVEGGSEAILEGEKNEGGELEEANEQCLLKGNEQTLPQDHPDRCPLEQPPNQLPIQPITTQSPLEQPSSTQSPIQPITNRPRPMLGTWNDKAVRDVLKKHKLEFVLLEMDYAGFDYSRALGDNYFGDNPSAA